MTNLFRHSTTILAGLLLIMAGIWYATGAAWAGGPTSVIIVSPTMGQAAALHTDDPRYQQLVEAIDAYGSPAGPTTPPKDVPAECFGCEIRVTWLIHDMSVWRIDRVYLTADDGIWVGSVSNSENGDIYDQTLHWRRPHDSKALLALLRTSGVLSESSVESAAPTTEEPVAASAGADPRTPLGLVAVGSGVVGVVVGLVGDRLVRLVRRRRSPADRVVLID